MALLICGGCSDDTESAGCDKGMFEGDLWISTQEGLAAAAGYTSISGDLTINCPACTDLSELNCLASVDRDFLVGGNNTLANLNGLDAVTTVGGCLQIGSLKLEGNDAIANLDGLSALTSVGEDLQIRYNGALTNLDGLSALTSVSDEFWIHYNDILPDCEACDLLDQLTTASTSIEVLANLDDDCTPVPTNCP